MKQSNAGGFAFVQGQAPVPVPTTQGEVKPGRGGWVCEPPGCDWPSKRFSASSADSPLRRAERPSRGGVPHPAGNQTFPLRGRFQGARIFSHLQWRERRPSGVSWEVGLTCGFPFPGRAGFVFRREPPAHLPAFAAARGAARAGMMAERLGAFKIMEFP